MYELIVQFAHWWQNTPYILNIAGSNWAFPFVQLAHFGGLSLWVGTNVALDLRLLGFRKGSQTAADLSDTLFAWNWIGFVIAIFGGISLFGIAAVAYVENPAFRLKLAILIPLGLILHIIIQSKVRSWSKAPDLPSMAKILGLVELLVWLAAVTSGVSIPYFE